VLALPTTLLVMGCGSSTPSGPSTSGLKFRALVSQDINSTRTTAGLEIIDAQTDLRPLIAPITAGATPGPMVETSNRAFTLAYSPTGNTIAIVSNSSEATANTVVLPGPTDSFIVSPDNQFGYAAIPTAFVSGQDPGTIVVFSLTAGRTTAQVNIPAVRYLSIGNTGNRILAFSNNSNSVVVVTPSNIGTGQPVTSPPIGGFDRPVAAFFSSDDNTAYVINCGPKCSGIQASVQTLDLTTNTPGVPVPVPAAEEALVNGTTMYVAGSPVPGSPCTGQTTQATSCGILTLVDLSTMTVINPSPIVITDGYHDRIALGSQGQLFVGAHDCTEINPNPVPPGAEVRGCLSIYNTSTGAIVIPPAAGDVTGIQPISNRNVVYLVQGGELQMYDTTTDALQETQINIIGQAVDVKLIDF